MFIKRHSTEIIDGCSSALAVLPESNSNFDHDDDINGDDPDDDDDDNNDKDNNASDDCRMHQKARRKNELQQLLGNSVNFVLIILKTCYFFCAELHARTHFITPEQVPNQRPPRPIKRRRRNTKLLK